MSSVCKANYLVTVYVMCICLRSLFVSVNTRVSNILHLNSTSLHTYTWN